MSSEIMNAQNNANEDRKEIESNSEAEFFAADSSNDKTDGLDDLLLDEQDAFQCSTADEDSEPFIELDATLTIQNVVTLYERLKKSYTENDAIEINASKVNSVDTATLQLLFALKKDAIKNQKQVIITNPSLKFIESARLLGLLDELGIDT
jgi:anti-anti-sigma regulatory factor